MMNLQLETRSSRPSVTVYCYSASWLGVANLKCFRLPWAPRKSKAFGMSDGIVKFRALEAHASPVPLDQPLSQTVKLKSSVKCQG